MQNFRKFVSLWIIFYSQISIEKWFCWQFHHSLSTRVILKLLSNAYNISHMSLATWWQICLKIFQSFYFLWTHNYKTLMFSLIFFIDNWARLQSKGHCVSCISRRCFMKVQRKALKYLSDLNWIRNNMLMARICSIAYSLVWYTKFHFKIE